MYQHFNVSNVYYKNFNTYYDVVFRPMFKYKWYIDKFRLLCDYQFQILLLI